MPTASASRNHKSATRPVLASILSTKLVHHVIAESRPQMKSFLRADPGRENLPLLRWIIAEMDHNKLGSQLLRRAQSFGAGEALDDGSKSPVLPRDESARAVEPRMAVVERHELTRGVRLIFVTILRRHRDLQDRLAAGLSFQPRIRSWQAIPGWNLDQGKGRRPRCKERQGECSYRGNLPDGVPWPMPQPLVAECRQHGQGQNEERGKSTRSSHGRETWDQVIKRGVGKGDPDPRTGRVENRAQRQDEGHTREDHKIAALTETSHVLVRTVPPTPYLSGTEDRQRQGHKPRPISLCAGGNRDPTAHPGILIQLHVVQNVRRVEGRLPKRAAKFGERTGLADVRDRDGKHDENSQ